MLDRAETDRMGIAPIELRHLIRGYEAIADWGADWVPTSPGPGTCPSPRSSTTASSSTASDPATAPTSTGTNGPVKLPRRFNQDFWLEDQGTYAFGLDRDKRPIDAVTSNAGHCLWTGIADPDKADRVADRLLATDMFSGFGIRTLATTMAAYNPVSYHYGSIWPHDNAIGAAGLAR